MAWHHYLCEISDKPASVLIDDRFAEQSPVGELPRLSWFGVYCHEPTGGAFWNSAETVLLDQVEKDLIKLSEQHGHGWVVYVLRIATPGIREYYLYHADHAELDAVLEALQSLHPDYRIDFDTIDDNTWEEYRRYLSFFKRTANR
jgi:hypothetical protein